MQEIDFIFSIIILIMSVVVHEVSHGFTAYALGDQTAKYAGRLTLNPLKHLDLFGSVIIPVITFLAGGFIFGWAKPVPYNPYNLRNKKWGEALVAGSGPLSNFSIAVVFGLMVRFAPSLAAVPPSFLDIAGLVVFINLVLGVFNLIPIPPLDGSKVLFAILPYKWDNARIFFEKYGFFFLLIFIFFLFQSLMPIVLGLFKIITGSGF